VKFNPTHPELFAYPFYLSAVHISPPKYGHPGRMSIHDT
jgi:hypothetical protein